MHITFKDFSLKTQSSLPIIRAFCFGELFQLIILNLLIPFSLNTAKWNSAFHIKWQTLRL